MIYIYIYYVYILNNESAEFAKALFFQKFARFYRTYLFYGSKVGKSKTFCPDPS